jgi:hypothetical protein
MSGKNADGPHWVIAATVHEGQPGVAVQVLWDEIQKHDAAVLLTDFAGINLLQSKEPFGGRVHEWLERADAIETARMSQTGRSTSRHHDRRDLGRLSYLDELNSPTLLSRPHCLRSLWDRELDARIKRDRLC